MIIGVIGVGVVGKAVYDAFSSKVETLAYDINGKYNELEQLCKCDVIFVCVPSPTHKAIKKQQLHAVEQTMQSLIDMKYGGVVCLKSTVLPGTCDRLKAKYCLRLTHNPEFLTAANPFKDFMDQEFIIVSGHPRDTSLVMDAYELILPNTTSTSVEDFKSTEVAKYIHNCFLATKVSFFNDMYDLCQGINANYNEAVKLASTQGKIGRSHTNVPGPDGSRGYSGACFPKDMYALLSFAKDKQIPMGVLEAAIEVNNIRRPDNFE